MKKTNNYKWLSVFLVVVTFLFLFSIKVIVFEQIIHNIEIKNHNKNRIILKKYDFNKDEDKIENEEPGLSTAKNSIVKIWSKNEVTSDKIYTGSGSIVKWDEKTQTAWIATANHVLETQKHNKYSKFIKITNPMEENLVGLDLYSDETYIPDFEYKTDQFRDIAILKIKLNLHNPYVYKIADYNNDQNVDVKGYPYGLTSLSELKNQSTNMYQYYSQYYEEGTNGENRLIDNTQIFEVNNMGHGNSGGPVLNKKNEIIGIVITLQGDKKFIQEKEIYDGFSSYASNLKDLMKI